jgi:tetratricopeptide (TPR) repeat protein
VTNAVLAIDPTSTMALRLQYGVYEAQNDQAKMTQTLLKLMQADPSNTALVEQVIATLVQSGKAKDAVPIIDSLVKANPGDPQYMRTRWLVLRAAQDWKAAIAAGRRTSPPTPTAADSAYYLRLIADYGSDSAYGKAAEAAAQAIAKYPRNAQLYLLKAQNERKAGQLDAAIASLRKGLELDPKAPWRQLAARSDERRYGQARRGDRRGEGGRRRRPDEQGAERELPARSGQQRVQGGRGVQEAGGFPEGDQAPSGL